jgi:hypothetical protein
MTNIGPIIYVLQKHTKIPWYSNAMTLQLKVDLKRYLITHSFYSVDKFLMFTNKS